jgi:hypothetical protein
MKLAFLVLALSFGATQAKDVVRGGGRALQGEFSMSMAGFEAADEEPVDYPTEFPTEFPTLSKSSKSTKSSKSSKCGSPSLLSLVVDDSRVFSIEVPASKVVACFLSGDDGDADLELYDENENFIDGSYSSFASYESVTSFGAVVNYDRTLKVSVRAAQSFENAQLECVLTTCHINLMASSFDD